MVWDECKDTFFFRIKFEKQMIGEIFQNTDQLYPIYV